MNRLKRNFQNRTTLPKDEYVGTITKISMSINGEMTIINVGAHLFTDEVNAEITIRMLNGHTRTYGMGHTWSEPASLQEIIDFAGSISASEPF
jgi:hypothetical protein